MKGEGQAQFIVYTFTTKLIKICRKNMHNVKFLSFTYIKPQKVNLALILNILRNVTPGLHLPKKLAFFYS